MGIPDPVHVAWSPDSTKLLTHRIDQRAVPLMHLTQSCPPDGSHRPLHHEYHFAMPGDPLPLLEMLVIELASGRVIPVDRPAQPMAQLRTAIESEQVFWAADSSKVSYIEYSRGCKDLRLIHVDATTGSARVAVQQSTDTFLLPGPWLVPCPVKVLYQTDEVLWWSQRDGWGHLYLYDLGTCDCKNQVTSGPWLVRDVVHVDEQSREVILLGAGREPGANPYFTLLYRATLDGRELTPLITDRCDHHVRVVGRAPWLVDSYGGFGQPVTHTLRDKAGTALLELGHADAGPLTETGFSWPEEIRVTAADGVTDLYGILYKPSDFDPTKSYPVLDSIYPGPQLIRQMRLTIGPFSTTPYLLDQLGDANAVAELGFIVLVLDGRGTPLQSKAFLDYSYGNQGDPGCLADQVAALAQVSATRPWMDLSRVGIYGHSGGGNASAVAILTYPDVYRAAVAAAGDYDLRGYYAVWGETYHGLPGEGDGDGGSADGAANYVSTATTRLAANLEGKLLIVHGEMDDNVQPGLVLKFVRALIDADKDFELLYVPNGAHGYLSAQPYVIRREWDFLVRHVMGAEPPVGYKIDPKAAGTGG